MKKKKKKGKKREEEVGSARSSIDHQEGGDERKGGGLKALHELTNTMPPTHAPANTHFCGQRYNGGSVAQKKCLAIGGCTALIIVIVILSTTFKTQKETEICLKYNTISRVVDPTPDTLPGTKALGTFTDLICYPKTVQKFEFSASSGASLITRTKEGLSIGLDVTIEYKFVTSKLLNLFELTGPYPTPVEAARPYTND